MKKNERDFSTFATRLNLVASLYLKNSGGDTIRKPKKLNSI